MATFRCGRFPTGLVPVGTEAGLVEFRDGVAVVDDPATAAALRAVPAAFAITENTSPEPPAPQTQQPARNAGRAAWVEYAVDVKGWDRAEAEELTRAELITRLLAEDDPPPGEDGRGGG